MKMSKLVKSLIRSNRGFSAAIALMYIMQAALILTFLILPTSIRTSIDAFIQDYGMPQGTIQTKFSDSKLSDQMLEISGIRAVESRAVLDTHVRMPNDSVFTLRLFSVEPDGFQRYHIEQDGGGLQDGTILLSNWFANVNDLQPGMALSVFGRNSEETMTVSDLITTPELISFYRNATSWYDGSDFGYLYLSRSEFDRLFGTEGLANQFLILFDEDADQDAALSAAAALTGDSLSSTSLYRDSAAKSAVDQNLNTLTVLATWMPLLIALIGLIFSCLFMLQVIRNTRPTIGLLRALGFSSNFTVRLFVRYAFCIILPATLVGMAVGGLLSLKLNEIAKSTYSLPKVYFSGNWLLITGIPIALLLSGVVSCMLVSSDIARIDPAEAFSARTHQLEPKTMRKENKLPLNEFVKISLNSTFRNPRRFILSFSCVSACLCLMIVSFGFMFSKDASLTNTFGKRYRYDCMAWFSSDTVLPLIQDLPGVEFVEPVISGFLTIESDSGSETAQINGLSTEEVLIHPMSLDGKDIPVPESGLIMDEGLARRLAVKAGENVKIDGHTVKIDAIAREMVNAIQYCSLSQAKQLGLDTVNAAAVRLDDEHSVSEFATEASSLSGFSYVVNLDKQKQDMRYSNKIMDIPTYLFTIFAVLTGFIIVYNMAIINLSERLREYATLRALGVHLHTMTLMSLIEAGTEFVCACLLGIPIGVVFMQNFLRALSSKGHDYPPMDSERIILLSCVLTLLCVLSGHLFTQNKIRKMDLPSILNSRE